MQCTRADNKVNEHLIDLVGRICRVISGSLEDSLPYSSRSTLWNLLYKALTSQVRERTNELFVPTFSEAYYVSIVRKYFYRFGGNPVYRIKRRSPLLNSPFSQHALAQNQLFL